MIDSYRAIYRDKLGKEITTIQNDGETLRMIIRDVEFQGDDFDSFEPVGDYENNLSALFPSGQNVLSACIIECDIPIPVVVGIKKTQGILHVYFKPREFDNTDLKLQLTLVYEGHSFESDGVQGYFDLEMYEIQKQLPTGVYIQTCTNCAFSESHPAGRGMFTGLACFRNGKEEFRAVKDKADLMRIWDKKAGFVQDTYLCQEFEPEEWLLQS